jgi:hypothetical protein
MANTGISVNTKDVLIRQVITLRKKIPGSKPAIPSPGRQTKSNFFM